MSVLKMVLLTSQPCRTAWQKYFRLVYLLLRGPLAFKVRLQVNSHSIVLTSFFTHPTNLNFDFQVLPMIVVNSLAFVYTARPLNASTGDLGSIPRYAWGLPRAPVIMAFKYNYKH